MEKQLLETLACPKCFCKLEYNEKEQQLICNHDYLVFRIVDGIPVLLESEAINCSESGSQG